LLDLEKGDEDWRIIETLKGWVWRVGAWEGADGLQDVENGDEDWRIIELVKSYIKT